MSWTAYRLVFRLLSPLHVGQGQVSNLLRARPYVPGKVLWGALVARLTRDKFPDGADYLAMGQRVNRDLAFSYLFPALPDHDPALHPDQPLYPHYSQDGQLVYGAGRLPAAAFDYLLRGAYAATALDYGRQGAEAGSLHEVEYIAPQTRDGRPVYLVGAIFEQSGCQLCWRDALNRLQLGGERGYGWGRVELKTLEQDRTGGPLCAGYTLDLDHPSHRPVVTVVKDQPALAHVLAAGDAGPRPQPRRPAPTPFRGPVEPLVGREWDNQRGRGAGRSIACDGVCWVPGARASDASSLVIGDYGVWEGVSG